MTNQSFGLALALLLVTGCGSTTDSSTGSPNTGGASGTQCRTDSDCPQLGCYMCPASHCSNGRCEQSSPPNTGGSFGSGGASSGGSSGAGGGTGGGGVSSGGGGAGGASDGAGGVGSALTTCPGTAPPDSHYSTCRTANDCKPGYYCTLDAAPGCGACYPPPPHQCNDDASCGTGQVCAPDPGLQTPCACSPGAPPGTHCVPRCTPSSCAAGESCSTNGYCSPTSCNQGFQCSPDMTCAPARTGADAHGCAIAICGMDAYTCPAGFKCAAVAGSDVHGCAPIGCNEGFTCPANLQCDPSSTGPHHCVRKTCSADTGCDCGACINGKCEDRLFVCWQSAV